MRLQQTDLAIEASRPGDDGYEAGARGFFATDHPTLILRPRGPDQVADAITYASRHGLAMSVRSGGHTPLVHGGRTDSMMIDLAHLDDIEVLDARRRLVRVGGGATWGQVAAALDPYGWAITAGDTSNVGVGGLTLGGGVGWMVRRYGLTIDDLVGARVVTADGRLLTTSQDEHPELFWALRGGGGNFGVVIDFDFQAQPVGTVHFGTVAYRDDPAKLLARWRDAMRVAPEELSSTLALSPRTAGAPPSATVLLCCTREPGALASEANAAIEPLLRLGTVTAASVSERRYGEILEQAAPPPGLRLTARNTLVETLDEAVIAAIARFHATSPVPTAIAVRSLGGAFGRVPEDATAFAHRHAEAMIVALLMLPDTATGPQVEQALVPWRAVAAHGIGTYLNFQGSATAADLKEAYPPATYARLVAVKRLYDPGNRFALNHNIEPNHNVEPTKEKR